MKANEFIKSTYCNHNWSDNNSKLIKLLTDFARQKCKEQREICADLLEIYPSEIELIINAPEPEL